MDAASVDTSCPLVVDLDGTLIATDTVWESMMLLCRQSPRDAVKIPAWFLSGGRAGLKAHIAEHVVPDAAMLPYRADVLDFVRQQKSAGRKIVLATAANLRIADAVARHLGLFDAVVASDASNDMKGEQKLKAIREQICSDDGKFAYIGDSRADVAIWRNCQQVYCVGSGAAAFRAAHPDRAPAAVFSPPRGNIVSLVKAMRPRQWIKNVLIFLPLILAHKITDAHRVGSTLIAFLAFSLCASCVYLLNDLLDIESDRLHPLKRLRPFAAGTLSIPFGLAADLTMLAAAFGIASLVNGKFALALLIYLALTSSYSFYFKGKLLLDVILLAGLYTLRIIAGALAAEVVLTQWLLAFSMFFFISLAFAKRYAELTMAQSANATEAKGRSYRVDDLEIILSVGPTAGYLSVLVFCLYISDSKVAAELYPHPQFLWLICPILLYWITRIWFFARRHALVDDPVVFALKDRVSWMAAGLTAILLVLAMGFRGV